MKGGPKSSLRPFLHRALQLYTFPFLPRPLGDGVVGEKTNKFPNILKSLKEVITSKGCLCNDLVNSLHSQFYGFDTKSILFVQLTFLLLP